MTPAELAALVGTVRDVRGDEKHGSPFHARVRVLAVKQSYGVPRVLVEPVSGTGRGWVNLDRTYPVSDQA